MPAPCFQLKGARQLPEIPPAVGLVKKVLPKKGAGGAGQGSRWILALFAKRGVVYNMRHAGWVRWIAEGSKEAFMSQNEKDLVERISKMLLGELYLARFEMNCSCP
jgi:hypothetical protein